jgi:signal transduction histidine kinase/CheY-like chemotaxis protein
MRSLPLSARWYLVLLWSFAVLLIGITFLQRPPFFHDVPLLLLWLLLFVVADYFGVEFENTDGAPVMMTVSEAPTIFLVATSGVAGVLIVMVGTLITDLLRRCVWYRCLFNMAERSVTFLAMLFVYETLHAPQTLPFSGFQGLITLAATAGIYAATNTLLVATIIALTSGQSVLKLFRDSFRTVHSVHSIILPLGAVLAALWQVNPWLVLPAVVPLLMEYRTLKTVEAWQAESRRSKAVATTLERLQDTATAMIASLEPTPLLETVRTQLAALLEASASWVVLLDEKQPRLFSDRDIPPMISLDVAGYQTELQHPGVRQLDPAAIMRLHGLDASPWQALVIIPLAVEQRVLGGICLALDQTINLGEADRRILLAFAAQAALAMEHAQLFEELRHKQDELIRSSKLAALGTFSAGIAHEFNNLLAGILGYAEIGLSSEDIATKDEALEVSVRSCLRGRSITSGLLTFARRGDPQRGLHQIREAVEDTLALVERELAKVNIRIERRFQLVPSTICDPGQLSQVVLNLVTNARDAMLEQGGGLITVVLAQRADQIELAISDTGSGIPEHLLKEVFQPFMTTKGALGGSSTPGTGLGLAISYGIIQSHGGTITIDSEVGCGTTVTIRLPIISETTAERERDLVLEPLPALRILIVDDDEVVAESVARLLEGQGHQVGLAKDGETALWSYCKEPFDLVLSDIVMPSMGGIELLQQLRAINPHVQMLIMTGKALPNQIEQMLRAGALGVVKKPFVVDELLAAIARGAHTRMLSIG